MTRKPHGKLNISDELSLLRTDFLTNLGQRILPDGHWGPFSERQSDKTIYLTYDDGPAPDLSTQLLELFESEHVSATFFLIGKHAAAHPELVKEIAQRGHAIGSHSLSHKVMPLLTTREIEREIHHANSVFADVLGHTPTLFRPPYGLVDQRAADCLNELGMKIVYWSAVPEDWLKIGAERVVERVLRRLTDGTIVVLHEQNRIAKQTLAATKQIIRLGKEQGFNFKALDTLC